MALDCFTLRCGTGLDKGGIAGFDSDKLVGGGNVAATGDQRSMVEQAVLGRIVPNSVDAFTVCLAGNTGAQLLPRILISSMLVLYA